MTTPWQIILIRPRQCGYTCRLLLYSRIFPTYTTTNNPGLVPELAVAAAPPDVACIPDDASTRRQTGGASSGKRIRRPPNLQHCLDPSPNVPHRPIHINQGMLLTANKFFRLLFRTPHHFRLAQYK